MAEVDPANTTNLKHLAQLCADQLQALSEAEHVNQPILLFGDAYWATRQSVELSMWCAKVGVLDEGSRSLDHRLKDVPAIFQHLVRLLKSLKRDLNGENPNCVCPRPVNRTH
jgi:hypothetical protein